MRRIVSEVIELADSDLLDVMRSRQVEQEVSDTHPYNEPYTMTTAWERIREARPRIFTFIFGGLVLWYVIPIVFLPAGVWIRREVRSEPLGAPLEVVNVGDDGLRLADGRLIRLAGVRLPDDPTARAAALDFVWVATRQGIEVVKSLPDGGGEIVRCEPRISHRCGNDSIQAHYKQFILNELVIAGGHGKFDAGVSGIDKEGRERLQICQQIADQAGGPMLFSPKVGIYHHQMIGLPQRIENYQHRASVPPEYQSVSSGAIQ